MTGTHLAQHSMTTGNGTDMKTLEGNRMMATMAIARPASRKREIKNKQHPR
jgi:hypothetical protein